MRETVSEVFQEAVNVYLGRSQVADNAPAKLHEQLTLIKSKEPITVKEHRLLC